MLTELYGKGGRVCQPAREGQLRCPLIVRPTSEDVITGHLALVLRTVNPRWWLPDLLNTALGSDRFQAQVFRRLRIEPWKNFKPYPQELLPWTEGSTQVDLTVRWENPPTLVFIETKYHASPATRVAADDGHSGLPSDQLIRNIRVGLYECGWFRPPGMFDVERADFVFILLAPSGCERLVSRYRDDRRLRAAIPHNNRLAGLPASPFIGELTYEDVRMVLTKHLNSYSRPERILVETLTDYLRLKKKAAHTKRRRQVTFPGLDGQAGSTATTASETKS